MKKECPVCNKLFSEHLIKSIVFIGEGRVDACPMCALTFINIILDRPIDTPFEDERERELYQEALFESLMQQKGSLCH